MINGLRKRTALERFSKFSLGLPHFSSRQRHEVLDEGVFRRIFSWERKRAERSERCFLLMLVSIESVQEAEQSKRTLSEVLSALTCSTRETDIIGWYKQDSILGVMFTEIEKTGKKALTTSLRSKVIEPLRHKPGAEQFGQIRASFHFFPENWGKSNSGPLTDPKLHREFIAQDDERNRPHLVKRAMDVAGSILALILFSPLFAVIAVAIKLSSKGPILFRQERVGQNGVPFTFLKFRSMQCVNDQGVHQKYVKQFIAGKINAAQAGNKQNVVYKIQNDPRVTRVGRFLRKTSLDELPQFINVLKGDMSLVGPRPPIPYELEAYQSWHRRRVMEAKPGITGLWQVNGRSRTTFDDMVRLDLRYARTWSPWLDLKILLQTPRAIFSGEGAY
jgi:lipopolysaccharide/colanic/teichoic acid biosynthesis glycosyltransferase